MKLTIENLGPIKHGEIQPRDIIVFIGPPNTGKSYTAKTIYAIHKAFNLYSMNFNKGFGIFYVVSTIFPINIEDIVKKLRLDIPTINDLETQTPYTVISRTISGKEIKDILTELIARIIKYTFDKVFRDYSEQLLSNSRIIIDTEGLRLIIDHGNVDIENLDKIQVPIKVTLTRDSNKVIISYEYFETPISISISISWFKKDPAKFIVGGIAYIIFKLITKEMKKNLIFIPYGRVVYSALLSSISRRPTLLISSTRVRKLFSSMPSPNSDYLNTLDEAIDQLASKELAKAVIEQDGDLALLIRSMLRGDIKILDREKLESRRGFVKYYDEAAGVELDLYNSSAMVEDIAGLLIPLITTLKRGKDTMVIIEEPESQLHPEYQRLVAWVLALLVPHNMKFVITTHSDFLITELAIVDSLKNVDQDKAVKIVRELLGNVGLSDEAIKRVIERVRRVNVAFYFFKDGEVREISTSEILMSIPSFVEQVDKQLNALREIYVESSQRQTDSGQ